VAIFIIYEIENGKIIKETILTDTLTLYLNLGQAILSSQNQEQIDEYMEHLSKIGLIPSQ
jgi:hypothetical protein